MSEAAWKEVFPYESRWYETKDGYRVHYIDQGSGIPVVIVAGFLGWAFYFRRLIRVRFQRNPLAPHQQPVGIDAKGRTGHQST